MPLTALCPAAVRVNETDTFADEDGHGDGYFDFEDISGMHFHWQQNHLLQAVWAVHCLSCLCTHQT